MAAARDSQHEDGGALSEPGWLLGEDLDSNDVADDDEELLAAHEARLWAGDEDDEEEEETGTGALKPPQEPLGASDGAALDEAIVAARSDQQGSDSARAASVWGRRSGAAATASGLDDAVLSRISLCPHKAGMDSVNKNKTDEVIRSMSEGSRFYDNERRKAAQTAQRVQVMKSRAAVLSTGALQQAEAMASAFERQLETERDLSRVIVHCDADAFYAAVELRDQPHLRGKPIGIGGIGMLSTASYEARKFGVRSAMPGYIALRLCPELILVKPRFHAYEAASRQLQAVMAQYDPNFRSVSLDEAYLDITDYMARLTPGDVAQLPPLTTVADPPLVQEANSADSKPGMATDSAGARNLTTLEGRALAARVVHQMRTRMHETTQLTVSAGIACNRMLAKIGSDQNKPDGQFCLPADRAAILAFLANMPTRKIPGIGKVTEQILRELDITNCQALLQQRALLKLLFTPISFDFFMRSALGIASNNTRKRSERKSIGHETTFRELNQVPDLEDKCLHLCHKTALDMERKALLGRSVCLKLKTVDFKVKQRSVLLPAHTADEPVIKRAALGLLHRELAACRAAKTQLRLRLMGVRVTDLQSSSHQRDQGGVSKRDEEASHPLGLASTTLDRFFHRAAEARRPSSEAETAPATSHAPTSAGLQSQSRASLSTGAANKVDQPVTASKAPANGLWNYVERTKRTKVVCPVCQQALSVVDNRELNAHVDVCLNRDVLRTVVS